MQCALYILEYSSSFKWFGSGLTAPAPAPCRYKPVLVVKVFIDGEPILVPARQERVREKLTIFMDSLLRVGRW